MPTAPVRVRSARPGGILVVGLGNPILGDDGVGWHVLDALAGREQPEVRLEYACVGGISLMELLVGHQRAIIVDAVIEPGSAAGHVWRRPLSEVETRTASHLDSSHDAPLPAALEAGRALGAELPGDIEVVGIVIERGDAFGEQLSDVVADAVPIATALVEAAVQEWHLKPSGGSSHA